MRSPTAAHQRRRVTTGGNLRMIPSDDRASLLVIASGPEAYRKYAFASLATRYRVHLLHTEPPSWQRPFLVGSDVVADFAPETLVSAARAVSERLAAQGRRLAGVM